MVRITGMSTTPFYRGEDESRTEMKQHDNFIENGLGFIGRGIPEAIFEKRAWDWIADVHVGDFLDRIDDLILNGTRAQWDDFFIETTDVINVDTDLTDDEWIEILQLQNRKQGERILSLDDSQRQLAHTNRRLKEVLIGGGVFALMSGLSIAYISREKDAPVSSSPVTPEVQSIPDEAQKILEQIQDLLDTSSRKVNTREF
ncbi:hypothetical protein KBB89_02105 [Candidatus Gracilibacteria bacterium]|nr:hypothetical protein [Candidatus Gracilibacteria bacterium]